MDYAYNVEYQPDVERRPAVPAAADDDGRGVVHGDVDARRRQRDRPQCARAGPGRDPAAAADSAVEPHQRHPLRREVDLSRRDVQGRAPLGEPLRLQRELHALALEGRCVEPRARPSRKRTCRRTCGTSSTTRASGRSRASTIATSSSPAASTSCPLQRARAGCRGRAGRLARQRHLHRADRRAVHGQPGASIARTSAPAPPSVPTSCGTPIFPAASARRSAGSTRRRSRCRRRSRSAALRATA